MFANGTMRHRKVVQDGGDRLTVAQHARKAQGVLIEPDCHPPFAEAVIDATNIDKSGRLSGAIVDLLKEDQRLTEVLECVLTLTARLIDAPQIADSSRFGAMVADRPRQLERLAVRRERSVV